MNQPNTRSAKIINDARLETVKELLHEAQIAHAAGEAARNSGEGTASILGYFEGRRAQVRDDEAKRDAKS